MDKIKNVKEAIETGEQLRLQHKKIVLVGGCFDVIHVGHILFLEEANKYGDVLFVLLESDETVKKLKGKHRPIYTQEDRARVLTALSSVNVVILLPKVLQHKEYDTLVNNLKPAIIATTKGDLHIHHKQRQAALAQAKLVAVVNRISHASTTNVVKVLQIEKEL